MLSRSRAAAARSSELRPLQPSKTPSTTEDDCESHYSSDDGGFYGSILSSSNDGDNLLSASNDSDVSDDEEDIGSDDSTNNLTINSDDDAEDELLQAAWRSQKYVSGTRARFEDDFSKMKRWINADERRKEKFLPIIVPFTNTLCIQYLNSEMTRKINRNRDLLAPGTIYQVQQMLKYEGNWTITANTIQQFFDFIFCPIFSFERNWICII